MNMFPRQSFLGGALPASRIFFVSMFALVMSAAAASQVQHVVVVELENHSYEEVVGNSNLPYLNGLISSNALAANYYANSHPSIGNYFRLMTGETVTNESNYNARVSVDNVVRRFAAAGKSWKNYAESIPSAGYLGGDVNPYVKRHNPFAYFTDVLDNPNEAAKIVPYEQFANDLASGALPNLAFIQVNQFHNGHDCPGGGTSCTNTDKLVATDQWLQANVPAILNHPAFQRDGLLVIWYDEGSEADSTNGGGHIAVVFAGPYAKAGYRSSALYRHENLGRTIFDLLGVNAPQSTLAYASPMTEMLQSEPTNVPPADPTPINPPPPDTAPINPPAPNGVLNGKITHAATGSALGTVLVAYSGGSFTTVSDGLYTFTGLADGTYALAASRSGYITRTVNATVTNGRGTLDFTLATGGKLAGTVRNSSGAAISGATVTIQGGPYDATYVLKTSSTGAYNSNWIPTGTYTVSVAANGYTTKSQNGSVPVGTTGTLNFTM